LKKRKTILIVVFLSVLALVLTAGCLDTNETSSSEKPKLIQTGSSTVLPLAIIWAEEFDNANIYVSGGGSSHGLNALLMGEADLGDASRLMKGKDYEKVGGDPKDVNIDGTANRAVSTGVWPYKWIVAYDTLIVVVNNENDWATQLNYSQLSKIFTDDNPAVYWDEVPGLNNPPHEKIEIYAPDEASGTYDFFFEEIIPGWGKNDQHANTRLNLGDGVYHPSADDNVILSAIKHNKYSIGYFGFAYYKENPGNVKAVWIAEGDDNFEEPSLNNVADYPMARPLHIYTDGIPTTDSVVNDYLRYILSEGGQDIVPTAGYVKLSAVDEKLVTDQLAKL